MHVFAACRIIKTVSFTLAFTFSTVTNRFYSPWWTALGTAYLAAHCRPLLRRLEVDKGENVLLTKVDPDVFML